MMIVQPIILGIVEGLTEFLPVSSTGHLILAGALLGYDDKQWQVFDIVIQLGAILAIVVLYWRTFWAVLMGMMHGTAGAWRFVRNILLAFMPAAVIGFALHKQIEKLLSKPELVCYTLILGGIAILLIEKFAKRQHIVGVSAMPAGKTIGIGFFQCLAMIPGVSRSGATIMGALSLGVERRTAAEFSFFLAVPTMVGATVLETVANRHTLFAAHTAVGVPEIAIGFITAFIVAIVVVKMFISIVSKHGFAPFAIYRILAGIGALAWLMNK